MVKHFSSLLSATHRHWLVAAVVSVVGTGLIMLVASVASTATLLFEAEDATLAGCVASVDDSGASSGKAVSFGCVEPIPDDDSVAGASLPIDYSLSSLSGTIKYVATSGSDSNSGSSSAPYATLAKAVSSSSSNGTIVVRGGTYRGEYNISVSTSKNGLRIIAYPGETPVFNGAQAVSGGWSTEGSMSYRSYTPRPLTDAYGIDFGSNQNLTGDGVGKYPDQAWQGNNQLQQVSSKSSVGEGKFWVDQSNNRIYLSSTDVSKGNVEVSGTSSSRMRFLNISANNVKVEGLVATRYSTAADDYGVILLAHTADNTLLKNVEISDYSFVGVVAAPSGSDFNIESKVENVTVDSSSWMGISANYTTDFWIEKSKIVNMNQFNEFTHSPQSGALKTARTRGTKVTNSLVANNKSHGIWYDQSNYQGVVGNNQIINNDGAGIFYEISDDLTLVNNYIKSSGSGQPAKLAGSSGLKIVNNTFVGGKDPLSIYTDSRSKPGCADPSQSLCSGSLSSDRDTYRTRPQTLDWMPRVDLMINNIIAYPASATFCGSSTPVCVTLSNSSASTTAQKVFHQANDPYSGIPKTIVNGNVYANGSNRIFILGNTNYSSVSALGAGLSGSPTNLSGSESVGLSGNNYVNTDGSPTSTLNGQHNNAYAVPSNSVINMFVPAGTKHYGVTYDIN